MEAIYRDLDTLDVKPAVKKKLEAAYEAPGVLAALAEITSSPAVWRVTDGGCIPVDVTTEEATLRRLGELCSLSLEIREKIETDATWS